MGVADKIEAGVGVEEEEEDQETVVKEIVAKEAKAKEIKGIKGIKEKIPILVIKLNVILTNLLSNHVFVTGPSEKVLIFVWSQPPALGRISLCPSQTNETVTSSAKKVTQRISSLCYFRTSYQKYIP